MTKTKPEKLSVVVPAYKAEKFIVDSLKQIKSTLDSVYSDYEIICVVDGDIDRTLDKAKKYARGTHGKVKVVGYKKNLGKGHAVRYGMSQAKGNIVGFVDAGLDLDTSGMLMLLAHYKWYDADIIVGSKRHPASHVTYPWQRKLFSFGYQIVVRMLFGLRVKDTQVGMKFFKREVVDAVLPRLLVKAFAFDVEILAVSRYLGFTKIYEAPINLQMDFGASTIASKGFIKTAASMLWDTIAVYYRLYILGYYAEANKKNWIHE